MTKFKAGDLIGRSPRSAFKIADIWRLNSPAFAKCARSRFLRSSLRIASKVNQSGWAILSHGFSKRPSMEPGNKVEGPHRRDRPKKSPGLSASIGGENRLRGGALRDDTKNGCEGD